MSASTAHRVALIIPARDEAATIGAVVRDASPFVDEVIVVDNGSRDATTAIATDAGAHVVREPTAGYGRACMAGVSATDARILVFMDGDGSDIPAAIPALVAAIEGGASLALGVRRGAEVEAGSMTSAARLGNAVAGMLLNLRYGRRLHDLSPLKAIRRDLLDAIAPREMTYGWTVEVLGGALRLNARIAEIDVGYRRRAGGVSKVSGDTGASARAAARILGTIARLAARDAGSGWLAGGLGAVTGAVLLIVVALWLASVPSSGIRAAAAVWLLAWPLLVTGAIAGIAVVSLARRVPHTDHKPAADTDSAAGSPPPLRR